VDRPTLFGMFGLLTLILAGAAITCLAGLLAGLPLDAALYLSAVIIITLGYFRYQRALRRTEE